MLLLSYPLTKDSPMYGGEPGFSQEPLKRITQGDVCNTVHLSFPNHFGTHLDAPYHFHDDGKTILDFSVDSWFAKKAVCLKLAKRPAPASLLGPEIIGRLSDPDAEVVFVKTGYGEVRQTENYWKAAPGFRPELAGALRKHFPRIRFFGFDLISLGSLEHREVSIDSHRAFLHHSHPIIILEDVNLGRVEGDSLSNVLISPLFIERGDGTPCTIWAELPG